MLGQFIPQFKSRPPKGNLKNDTVYRQNPVFWFLVQLQTYLIVSWNGSFRLQSNCVQAVCSFTNAVDARLCFSGSMANHHWIVNLWWVLPSMSAAFLLTNLQQQEKNQTLMTTVKLKYCFNYNGKPPQLCQFPLVEWRGQYHFSLLTSMEKQILYVTLVLLFWSYYFSRLTAIYTFKYCECKPIMQTQLCSSPFCFLKGSRHKSNFPEACDFIILTL